MGNGSLSTSKKLLIMVGLALVILGIVYAAFKAGPKTNTNPNACVNRTFSLGTSGNCISDAQNLINWYAYGIDQPNYLAVNGQFSSHLVSVVKTIQSGASLSVNGTLDPPTWKLLCSSNDTPSWWTSAARNAGCSSV